MEQMILHAATLSKLNGLTEPLQVCDEAGRIFGYFLPGEMYPHLLVSYARAVVSDEEIERRMKEPGACSLQEIWARLGNV
jgi:hypothetical protein